MHQTITRFDRLIKFLTILIRPGIPELGRSELNVVVSSSRSQDSRILELVPSQFIESGLDRTSIFCIGQQKWTVQSSDPWRQNLNFSLSGFMLGELQ